MNRNYGMVLTLSALILTVGCKKSINPSVDLSGGAKGGFTSNAQWQAPTITGRLIRYDINDGNNSDCILSYDLGTGVVTLTKFSNGSSTTISPPSIGFNTDQGTAVYVGTWNTDVTDNYNEVGGVHVIPFDYNGTGHEDHILLYIPGHGLAIIMHYLISSNTWHVDYTNDSGNHTSGSGIGGYDLMRVTDKIISYDYGSGTKNYLICYRPGNGIVWIMHSNASSSNPNPASVTWTDDVQFTAGIGGFDMGGVNDQLVCIGGPSLGSMNLAAYRPGNGLVWFMKHPANSTAFGGTFTQTSGLDGFSEDQQDRIVTMSNGSLSTAAVVPEDDGIIYTYRPGGGTNDLFYYEWLTGSPSGPDFYSFSGSNVSNLLETNPYPTPSTLPNNAGDHILAFAADGLGYNTSMLFYTPGKQSQLYYFTNNGINYIEEY